MCYVPKDIDIIFFDWFRTIWGARQRFMNMCLYILTNKHFTMRDSSICLNYFYNNDNIQKKKLPFESSIDLEKLLFQQMPNKIQHNIIVKNLGINCGISNPSL